MRPSIKIDPEVWLSARHAALDAGLTVSQYIDHLIRNDVDELSFLLQHGALTPFSFREEANAITALAFRNGFLEDLHAGKHSPLLEDESLSRITDREMKKLMVEASAKIEELLRLRERDPERYRSLLQEYGRMYCHAWTRSGKTVNVKTGKIN